MKKLKVYYLGIILSLIGGCFVFAFASAESGSLSDAQLQHIKFECIATKSTLNQLHTSDALLRVNVGQLYETISTKLMQKFNERANFNNMNDDALVDSTNKFSSLLSDFRNDYISYENNLSIAINTDCSSQPGAFYDAVLSARTSRQRLHDDIVSLNQELSHYEQLIRKFETDNSQRIKELDNNGQ